MVNLPGRAEVVDLKRLSPKLRTNEFYFETPEELVAFASGEIVASKLKMIHIADKAGCSPSTVSNFVHRVTRSPQVRTILNVLRVLGWEIVVRK